ncbi:MAG: 16S rRNA (uracil(1498)-N(3))-methyltransferase [Clostridia bacterium]|nr:16S rRNA (uracil(1498)-N(3))-methyltransferase [Clostridia bacterium]
MSKRIFYVENINPESTEITLAGEEFVHAKTVLRVKEGAEILFYDGSGNEYSAIVAKIEKHSLTANITGVNVGSGEPQTPVYLLCGLLKGDKTELVVQKATELGVSKIGIFNSQFCSAYINENKLERLKRVAREASKQCRRPSSPEIVYFASVDGALKSAQEYENKLFACEFLDKSEGEIMGIKGSTALVVGSEGGFSREEFCLAQSLGYTGISLGKRILRAETAAVSLCALAAYALGELK